MKLSIVATMYRSAPFVAEFCRRASAAAARVAADYELILVNDGSPDESLEIACRAAAADSRLVVVDLARNFGHHQAVVAGLARASGDRVFLIDIDLEEQPEWLVEFWRRLDESASDVVYGVESRRQGSWFRKLSGSLFYKLFNLLSETKISANACTVRLMTRRYVRALLSLAERNLFLAGSFAWVGFRQQAVEVAKQLRGGRSNYTLLRRLRLFVDAVTSFSSYPLQLVFFVGAAICLASAVVGACLVADKLLHPSRILLGWSSLMTSIWFLGGLTIGSIGLIGMYLSRVFVESKRRPLYVVREVYGQWADEAHIAKEATVRHELVAEASDERPERI